MYLPIKDFDRRVVTVMANLDGVTLRRRQQSFEATGIAGDLWVRNREIHAPALVGPGARRALAGGNRNGDAGERESSYPGHGAGQLQGSALQPIARLPQNAGLAGTHGLARHHSTSSAMPIRNSPPAGRCA